MVHTTFKLAHDAGACIESYRKMGESLGGISKYGKDTPIPLDKVVEVCGLEDAIWALRCTLEPCENLIIEFACRCAEHTLHFFEDKYPDDKRPRQAIEAARKCITDKSKAAKSAAGSAARSAWSAAWSAWAVGSAESAAKSAWSAAESAAKSAAKSAAESAACSVARSAEREWQTRELLALLKE